MKATPVVLTFGLNNSYATVIQVGALAPILSTLAQENVLVQQALIGNGYDLEPDINGAPDDDKINGTLTLANEKLVLVEDEDDGHLCYFDSVSWFYIVQSAKA